MLAIAVWLSACSYESEKMSLITTIEALQKRPLTADESTTIKNFQKAFDIEDDDPLIVVLALMSRSQLILESMPTLLQQKSSETIELHRTVLRDQSVLIAKELISDVSQHIDVANRAFKARLIRYVGCFVGGGVFTAGLFLLWTSHLAK